MAANAVIAIVDDDDLVGASLASLFRSFGVRVEVFSSAAHLLSSRLDHFDIVVSDLNMPGLSGLELRRELRDREVPLPVIIITAYPERAVEGSPSDKAPYLLEKPVDSARLIDCIETVLGRAIS